MFSTLGMGSFVAGAPAGSDSANEIDARLTQRASPALARCGFCRRSYSFQTAWLA